MAKYANSHFNQYVQERDLKESILTEIPVPSNITEVKELEEFMSHLLKENNQTSVCALDTKLEKIQKKNIDVIGPLSKVWNSIESATTAPDEEADLVQQTVLLVEQTNNTKSNHRRLMKSSSQVKSIIKDKMHY